MQWYAEANPRNRRSGTVAGRVTTAGRRGKSAKEPGMGTGGSWLTKTDWRKPDLDAEIGLGRDVVWRDPRARAERARCSRCPTADSGCHGLWQCAAEVLLLPGADGTPPANPRVDQACPMPRPDLPHRPERGEKDRYREVTPADRLYAWFRGLCSPYYLDAETVYFDRFVDDRMLRKRCAPVRLWLDHCNKRMLGNTAPRDLVRWLYRQIKGARDDELRALATQTAREFVESIKPEHKGEVEQRLLQIAAPGGAEPSHAIDVLSVVEYLFMLPDDQRVPILDDATGHSMCETKAKLAPLFDEVMQPHGPTEAARRRALREGVVPADLDVGATKESLLAALGEVVERNREAVRRLLQAKAGPDAGQIENDLRPLLETGMGTALAQAGKALTSCLDSAEAGRRSVDATRLELIGIVEAAARPSVEEAETSLPGLLARTVGPGAGTPKLAASLTREMHEGAERLKRPLGWLSDQDISNRRRTGRCTINVWLWRDRLVEEVQVLTPSEGKSMATAILDRIDRLFPWCADCQTRPAAGAALDLIEEMEWIHGRPEVQASDRAAAVLWYARLGDDPEVWRKELFLNETEFREALLWVRRQLCRGGMSDA